jgi:DNA-binding CsgD family transcriptional regulator
MQVTLDARTWWKLATLAEKQDTTITSLIEEHVDRMDQPVEVPPSVRITTRGDEVRQQVANLHAQGLNDRQIAEAMHCTRANVRQHRLTLRLPSNAKQGRLTVDQAERAEAAVRQGVARGDSDRQIAVYAGIHQDSVGRLRRRLGLASNYRGPGVA